MKYLIQILALFILLVLQTGIFPSLGLGQSGSLILLFAIASSLVLPLPSVLFVAAAGGVMLDFASGTPDGLLTISLVLTGLAVYFVVHKILVSEPNRLVLFGSTAGATIFFVLIFLAANELLSLTNLAAAVDWRFILGRKLILDIVINIVLAYPIYLFFLLTQRIEKRVSV